MMKLHDLLLSRSDAETIAAMLDTHRRGNSPDAAPAAALAEVLAHARRVPDEALSADRVALGSSVSYVESTSGVRRSVTLATPEEADFSARRISVLSPVGRALIGRRRGAIVDVRLPERRLLEIQILATSRGEPLRKAA